MRQQDLCFSCYIILDSLDLKPRKSVLLLLFFMTLQIFSSLKCILMFVLEKRKCLCLCFNKRLYLNVLKTPFYSEIALVISHYYNRTGYT